MKRKTKQIIVIILIAVMVITLLAGCIISYSSTGTQTKEDTATVEEKDNDTLLKEAVANYDEAFAVDETKDIATNEYVGVSDENLEPFYTFHVNTKNENESAYAQFIMEENGELCEARYCLCVSGFEGELTSEVVKECFANAEEYNETIAADIADSFLKDNNALYSEANIIYSDDFKNAVTDEPNADNSAWRGVNSSIGESYYITEYEDGTKDIVFAITINVDALENSEVETDNEE